MSFRRKSRQLDKDLIFPVVPMKRATFRVIDNMYTEPKRQSGLIGEDPRHRFGGNRWMLPAGVMQCTKCHP